MKIHFARRFSSLLLATVFVLSLLTFSPLAVVASDEDDPTPENIGTLFTDENTGVSVSFVRRFEENDVPLTAVSGVGSHGGHETRIVRTENGVYATYITKSEPADEAHQTWDNGIATFSIVKITSGGFHVIYTDIFPQSQGSCTPNIINAGDGKIYVTILCGDPDRYHYSMGTPEFTNAASLSVYEVDTATDTVTAPDAPTVIDYNTTPFEDHGYGYTQPILDTEHGKLYALACGGEAPGYMAWFIYDLETRTWDTTCHTYELFARYCYINGYPDGNGGFTIVVERDAPITALKEALGVNFSTTSGYAFDAISVMHVADPTVDELVEIPVCSPNYTAEGYKNSGGNRMDGASHYGPDGCTYLDDQSRLHIIFSQKVGNAGTKTVYHAIFDLEGNELYRQKIPTSLIPKNGTSAYSRNGFNGFAMTQGSDGQYYVFALTNASEATLEIWSSPSDDGKTFQKIVGPLTLTDAEGNTISSAQNPIIANTRNHSVIDGVTDIMFHSTDTVNGGDPYYFISVRLDEPSVHVHDYVGVITEPTCTEQGYTTYTCSVCGDEYIGDYVEPLGHDCTDFVKEPTCTELGYTVHTCTRCGEYTVDSYIEKLGHDYGEWVVTTEPTCILAGEKTSTCARCGKSTTRAVAPLIHDYEDFVTDPTCEEQGYTTHTCSRCGDSYVDTYVDALGHDWDDGVVTTPATAEAEGIRTYTCRKCGKTRTETVPKIVELEDTTKVFKDVLPNKWYTEAINYVYTFELMNGMTDDTFAPGADMSRAMLVTVLWRSEGSPAPEGSTPFTDLKAKWYKQAVAWAYENNIVKGMTETSFAPDASVTREQIATIFHRFASFKGYDVEGQGDISRYPDAPKIGKYARNAMLWAVGEGLISGTKIDGKDYLDPKGNATRAQVATILMRYLKSRENPRSHDVMFEVIKELDSILAVDEAGRIIITLQTPETVNAQNIASIIISGTRLDSDAYEIVIEDEAQIDGIREEYGGLGFGRILATDEVGFAVRNKETGRLTEFEYYPLCLIKDVWRWTGEQIHSGGVYTYYSDENGPLVDETSFGEWLMIQLNETHPVPDYDSWTISFEHFDLIKSLYDSMIENGDSSVTETFVFYAHYKIPMNEAHLPDPTYGKSVTVTFVAPTSD